MKKLRITPQRVNSVVEGILNKHIRELPRDRTPSSPIRDRIPNYCHIKKYDLWAHFKYEEGLKMSIDELEAILQYAEAYIEENNRCALSPNMKITTDWRDASLES